MGRRCGIQELCERTGGTCARALVRQRLHSVRVPQKVYGKVRQVITELHMEHIFCSLRGIDCRTTFMSIDLSKKWAILKDVAHPCSN